MSWSIVAIAAGCCGEIEFVLSADWLAMPLILCIMWQCRRPEPAGCPAEAAEEGRCYVAESSLSRTFRFTVFVRIPAWQCDATYDTL
jgi:hypothetical protein